MIETYHTAKREIGYNATRFIRWFQITVTSLRPSSCSGVITCPML